MENIPHCKQAVEILRKEKRLREADAVKVVQAINPETDGEGVREILRGEYKTADEYINRLLAPEVEEAPPVSKLPAGLMDTIQGIIDDFCRKCDVERYEKMGARKWSSVCYLIGDYIKRNRILVDDTRRSEGGTVYDPDKIDELIDVWAIFCGAVNTTPLVHDFRNFSGLSETYIYNGSGRYLTSSDVDIHEKIKRIQEGGLVSNMANGGGNVVGSIFLSKALHGYRETKEVIHTVQDTRKSPDEIARSMGIGLEMAGNGDL